MVFFNWATMQMAAKIVYYGPGLCGKTSNLSYIYAKTTPNSRGEMVSLETESDRTLFFDLLPIEVGTIGGFKTRLQLYTVPGQVFYNTTRKLVLKGVDGLVFVADSQRPMREANIESFASLVDNIKDLGLEMVDLPLVLQYNKRDLKNILTVDELNADLNPHSHYPYHGSSAINGDGVFETLKEITKLTLKKLRKRMASSQPGGAAAPASEPVRPAMPPQRPESISAASLARAAEEGVVADPAPEPVPAAPMTPTTIAAPQAATPIQPPAPDVFETPSDEPEEPPTSGFLEGTAESVEPIEPVEPIDLGSMEVTAPEVKMATDDEEAIDLDVEFDSDAIGPGETLESAADQWSDRSADTTSSVEEIEEHHDADPAEHVDFEQHSIEDEPAEPPPVKRVHVSNQLDILAELEGLRVGSTSDDPANRARSSSPELDIDSLISGAVKGSKEISRRSEQQLDAKTFQELRGLDLSIRLRDATGNTIHTLEPVILEVDGADDLSRLSIRFVVDLKNDG